MRESGWQRLEARGAELERLLQPVLAGAPFPVHLVRLGSLFWLSFHEAGAPRTAATLTERRALRGAFPRDARPRRVPAAVRLRGVLPVARTHDDRPHALRDRSRGGPGGDRMKSPRVFQLTALALVVVSAVQVGWWLFDQHAYTVEKVNAARAAYAGQTAAAQALLKAGTPASRVQQLLPQIRVNGTQATLAPAVEQALRTEEHRRNNQYAWEGGFFLLALGVCIAVIARALRAEARVLEEQDGFLALVSHQFKTPLASLQLSLETMALRAPAPERRARSSIACSRIWRVWRRWSPRSSRARAWSAAVWT